MSADFGSSTKGAFRIMNPDDLSRMIEKKLPRTEIERKQKVQSKPKHVPVNEAEERIVSEYLVEHFQDIGGWKPKSFLSVGDIEKIPDYRQHLPVEIQKFEVKEKILPESIFEPLPQPEYVSLYSSYKSENKEIRSSVDREKEERAKVFEEKVRRMEEKIGDVNGESEFERMVKLKTRNKKAFAMVDDLLKRADKKRSGFSRK